MQSVPLYIPAVFAATTFLTLYFLYRAAGKSKMVITISLIWLALQAGIALTGFYLNTDTMPPRIIVAIGIPLITVLLLVVTKKGSRMTASWDLRWLTVLHIVRIPVELVLFWLFLYKKVPELMTFEGINYDILSGITAPLIVWIGFSKSNPKKWLLLAWNFICLLLLINIVVHAVLSAPLPFQQFAFDQPNIAVMYFPYVWLPAFVVPVVLLSHLVTIRSLLRNR